jgi:hypothetical protein
MDIRACDYHSRAVGDRGCSGFLLASLIARDVVVDAAVPLVNHRGQISRGIGRRPAFQAFAFE